MIDLLPGLNGNETDAHDILLSGPGETYGYDLNGNQTSVGISGVTFTYTYDDEDRLIRAVAPGNVTDTFVYNGLGLRVAKTDSTGTYSYLCDGASPGSPVLSDGHAVYTPGQSERRGGASSFPDYDTQGNLWTLDAGSGQSYTLGLNFSGFGAGVYTGGSSSTPFRYGGANGCQTDGDTGLVLMGHRYYDSRLGRFITQDPAGSGDNWYAYCRNNPVNGVDPEGLEEIFRDPALAGQEWQPGWQTDGGDMANGVAGTYDTYTDNHHGGLTYDHSTIVGPSFSDFFMAGGLGLNMGSQRAGMGGGAFAAGRGHEGNVNHSDDNATFDKQMKDLLDQRHGGGKTPEDRKNLDKQINELKRKMNTNQKGDGDRNKKKRASNFEIAPTPHLRNTTVLLEAGIVGAGTGYIIYQIGKDAIAVLGAPETGGASLALLFVP